MKRKTFFWLSDTGHASNFLSTGPLARDPDFSGVGDNRRQACSYVTPSTQRLLILTLLVLIAATTIGCASGPPPTRAEIERTAQLYEQTADDFRNSGHEEMAEYFEQKAKKTRDEQRDKESGLLGIIIESLFEKAE